MPAVICVTKETYEQYEWLRDIFKPGENKLKLCEPYNIGVMDGDPSDGIVEVHQFPLERTTTLERTTIVKDDGAVFEDISNLDKERLYLGIYSGKPTRFIDATQAKEFIRDMLSPAALSKSGRAEFCRSNKCENPEVSPGFNAWFYAEHGDCARAERSLKKDPDPFYGKNNLAWFYATAKEPEFKRPKEAIKLAKEVIKEEEDRIGERVDSRGRMIFLGPFYHTLAMAYYADGNYDEALKAIKYVESDWSPSRQCRAMKELILEKKWPGWPRWYLQFVSNSL